MRRFYGLLVIFLFSVFPLPAQELRFGRITITPYIPAEARLTEDVAEVLRNKLSQVVVQANASGGFDKRFVITPKVEILSQVSTPTIPQKISLKVQMTFFVGDGVKGTLFASCGKVLAAVGDSYTGALIAAARKIPVEDRALREMVNTGCQRIAGYYDLMAPRLISEAEGIAAGGKYDEAIACLSVIPYSCRYFERAQDLVADIASKRVSNANTELLLKAESAWASSPNSEGADKAASYLEDIAFPSEKIAAGVSRLSAAIKARLVQIDNQRFRIQQQRIANEARLERQRLAGETRLEQQRIAGENNLRRQRMQDDARLERQRLAQDAALRREKIRAMERVAAMLVRTRTFYRPVYRPVYRVSYWY